MTDGESLRLLSIEARNPWADRIFDRRVSARDARTPVQMPEGRVVVGRFDRKTNDAIALAKPVEIRAGKTALVWPEAPADSDVLLILTKPPELQLAKPIPARLAIDDGTSKRAPDVLLNGFDRIIAIWYGVAARRATISFQIPPKSTQLLILPPAAYASNAYDSVAQRVEYPWPARVTAPKF
jgi:hypothetical protein